MKGHRVIKCKAAVTVSPGTAAVSEVLLYVLGCVMQSGGLTKHCDGRIKGFAKTIYIKLK